MLDGLAASGALDGRWEDQEQTAAEEQAAAEEGRMGPPLTPAQVAGLAVEYMDPGPSLAGWLQAATSSAARLGEDALAGVATACRRQAAWAQAGELTAIAHLSARAAAADPRTGNDGRPARICRDALAQISLALTLSACTTSWWADLAVTLTWRLPATGAALAAGRIDLDRARAIADTTAVLTEDQARAVEAAILPEAGRITRAHLKQRLHRAVLKIDPGGAEHRRRKAERHADVRLYADDDQTASLIADKLPQGHSAAGYARITALARARKTAGLPGTLGEHKAIVLLSLILGTIPPAPPNSGPSTGPDGPGPVSDPGETPPPTDADADADAPQHNGPDDPSDGKNVQGSPGRGPQGHRPDSQKPDPNPGNPGPGPDDGNHGPSPGSSHPDNPGRNDRSPGHGPARTDPAPLPGDKELPPPGDDEIPTPADADAPDDDGLDDPPGAPEPDDSQDGDSIDDLTGPAPQWPRLDTIPPAPAHPPPPHPPPPPQTRGEHQGTPPGEPRPQPPLLDLTLPWTVLAGLGNDPGHLGHIGPITAGQARHLTYITSHHPATQWRVIVTNPAGHAIAVARIPRRTRDGPAPPRLLTASQRPPPAAGLAGRVTLVIDEPTLATHDTLATLRTAAAHSAGRRPGAKTAGARKPAMTRTAAEMAGAALAGTALADAALAAAAGALAGARDRAAHDTAAGGCAHTMHSTAYRPPPRLRDLITARDQTCRFPTCRLPAWRGDLDHTIPWDHGGRTCTCNLGGSCRAHHQLKQHPRWHLDQPAPGIFTWTTPADRTYTTYPDPY